MTPLDYILMVLLVISIPILLLGALIMWGTKKKVTLTVRKRQAEAFLDFFDLERATQEIMRLSGAPQVFMAYSHEDTELAERLARDLRTAGLQTWLFAENIRPGDRWVDKVEIGLRTSGYLLDLVSNSSLKSECTRREVEMALERERRGEWPRVIPVLIEDVEIPENVRHKVYVDLRRDYKEGFAKIVNGIAGSAKGRKYGC